MKEANSLKKFNYYDNKEKLRENIAYYVSEALCMKNITQKELAKYIGIDESSVSRSLRAERDFNVYELKCIAEFLDITVDEIITGVLSVSYTHLQCTFLENSHFCNELQKKNDFVNFTKLIATSFFNIMIRNVSIPNADLIIAEVSIDNILYLVMLKLNYKSSFIHHYSENNGLNNNTIIKQRTVLPCLLYTSRCV